MDDSSPNISDSEWLVATVVWNEDGLTSAQIAERLTTSWKLKTINTFLTRLVNKGVLTTVRDGRAFRYSARVPRDQCVQAESKSFLQRVFGGSVAPLLAHFCEETELNDAEIAELRQILRRKTSEAPRPSKTSHRKT
jgi:BlaI family penicillinase repressor